jgi:methionine synthase II (cobalamin-independent)
VGCPAPAQSPTASPTSITTAIADKLAFDYADAIHHEVEALIAAGLRIHPVRRSGPAASPGCGPSRGVQALERCFAGLEDKATFAVHICRGYPNKPLERKGIHYKANEDYYRDILSWLSDSKLECRVDRGRGMQPRCFDTEAPIGKRYRDGSA